MFLGFNGKEMVSVAAAVNNAKYCDKNKDTTSSLDGKSIFDGTKRF
jgi:hypothetical protein